MLPGMAVSASRDAAGLGSFKGRGELNEVLDRVSLVDRSLVESSSCVDSPLLFVARTAGGGALTEGCAFNS